MSASPPNGERTTANERRVLKSANLRAAPTSAGAVLQASCRSGGCQVPLTIGVSGR